MNKPKSELLSIDEIAALMGKSIEDTKKILEEAGLPIADREGKYDLYDANVISEYIAEHPEVMF